MVGWKKCGNLMEAGARIDDRVTFEVEDGVSKYHGSGVGFTQTEL